MDQPGAGRREIDPAFGDDAGQRRGLAAAPGDAAAVAAAFQPATSASARAASANHAEPPAAQYACTTSGVAPTVIRSLIAIAIVSWAIAA